MKKKKKTDIAESSKHQDIEKQNSFTGWFKFIPVSPQCEVGDAWEKISVHSAAKKLSIWDYA